MIQLKTVLQLFLDTTGFLIDMRQLVNVEPQGKEQLNHNLYDKIQGFERKLKL